jgi:hypothetical protein
MYAPHFFAAGYACAIQKLQPHSYTIDSSAFEHSIQERNYGTIIRDQEQFLAAFCQIWHAEYQTDQTLIAIKKKDKIFTLQGNLCDGTVLVVVEQLRQFVMQAYEQQEDLQVYCAKISRSYCRFTTSTLTPAVKSEKVHSLFFKRYVLPVLPRLVQLCGAAFAKMTRRQAVPRGHSWYCGPAIEKVYILDFIWQHSRYQAMLATPARTSSFEDAGEAPLKEIGDGQSYA